jgi:DNA-binding CsgD family transcriptional regulator
MSEIELLSALIGDIYDAALDPALWPVVLASVAGFAGGQAAGLLSKDFVSKVGNAEYYFGVDERYIRLYRESYWKFDPLSPLIFFPTGEIVSSTDIVPDEELHEGRFYREWLKPQGWIDAANVVLDKSATSFAILSVVRKAVPGPVDDEMRRRMRLVFPHVRRAALIGKVIDLRTAEAATFADTLDGISAGMFLIDVGKRIVHANAAGRSMLANADILRATDGRLLANDPEAEIALREIAVAAGKGDTAIGIRGIAVPLIAKDGDRYVAHVLPLTSGARRRAGAAYTAVAAIFVHRAALEVPSPPEAIARAYKLTPTELRVLLAIVEVGGAPEVAAALGVGEGTIKTHLSRLYEKTGTGRQADLVKLVAGFSSPLLG